MKRLAMRIALALVLLAGGWVWVFGAASDTHCNLQLYPTLPEGSSYHVKPGLWSPGTKCVYELPDGSKTTRSSFP